MSAKYIVSKQASILFESSINIIQPHPEKIYGPYGIVMINVKRKREDYITSPIHLAITNINASWFHLS